MKHRNRARRGAIRRYIDDVLQLQVIEQEPIDGTIVAAREVAAKALAVKPAQAGLTLERATHEVHFAGSREQVHHLVVQTLVEVVAIRMLQLADRLHVVEQANFVGKLLHLSDQGAEIGRGGHRVTSVVEWVWAALPNSTACATARLDYARTCPSGERWTRHPLERPNQGAILRHLQRPARCITREGKQHVTQ